MLVHFCPECGIFVDNDDRLLGVCGYCGARFADYFAQAPEEAPQRCERHPKYEGVGLPKDDCVACLVLHKHNTEKKIQELRRKLP